MTATGALAMFVVRKVGPHPHAAANEERRLFRLLLGYDVDAHRITTTPNRKSDRRRGMTTVAAVMAAHRRHRVGGLSVSAIAMTASMARRAMTAGVGSIAVSSTAFARRRTRLKVPLRSPSCQP